MRVLFDNRRHLLTAVHDLIMAGASFLLAFYLRLGDDWLSVPMLGVATSLFMLVSLSVFSRMRLYRGLWRYASTPDLLAIAQAATFAVLLFYFMLFWVDRLTGIPRSVPFIQWLLLVMLLGGPRFVYRIVRDRMAGLTTDFAAQARIPVLLLGAGDRAELFLRDTRSGASAHYQVVGLLDDDTQHIGHTIHNVRIYGTFAELPQVMARLARKGIRPQRAVLATDGLDGAGVRSLLAATDALGLPLARLPRLSEFRPGMQAALDIRPIAVEDLLGRPQLVHDKTRVAEAVAGRVVVVTGAGGSIGSELVRQVAGFGPARLILFELSEYALYQIDRELGEEYPGLLREAVLGDVRSAGQLEALFTRTRPDLVFHAAAIKHVPLAEANPEEAILTNVFGTRTLADACVAHKVGAMVLISTDKAVNPMSVMGASKRAAECYCQALSEEGPATRFVAVRFGNVLGSTGSVVPLFQAQLQKGGPLTVTHPEMVRFFMTVREAVELVLQAAALEHETGAVYVLDMGQPVKILDLAEQMIRLAGLKPYEDIAIAFSGLRPGEKMYEELFHLEENSVKTAHASIWLAGVRHPPMEEMRRSLAVLFAACEARNAPASVEALKRIVPEFYTPLAEAS